MIFKMCQRTPPAEAIIALSVAVSGAGSAHGGAQDDVLYTEL